MKMVSINDTQFVKAGILVECDAYNYGKVSSLNHRVTEIERIRQGVVRRTLIIRGRGRDDRQVQTGAQQPLRRIFKTLFTLIIEKYNK